MMFGIRILGLDMFFRFRLLLEKYRKEVVLFVLIFLISTISFGLGYLVANQFDRIPIIIEKNSEI
jgi:hypothetical protein